MNNLKNIKEILSKYEVEYNHKDWIKLEKDIPKSGMSGLLKTILVASTVIIAVSAAIFIINGINKETTNQTKSANNTTSTVVIENNNDDIYKEDITENDNNIVEVENKIIETDKSFIQQSTNSTTEKQTSKTVADNHNNNNTQTPIIKDNNPKDTKTTEPQVESTSPDISKTEFYYELSENCTPATIKFKAKNVPENCSILWNTGDNYRITENETEYTYTNDGIFYPEVSIIYNNFVLKNEKLNVIELNNPTKIKINFTKSENLHYFTCDNEEGLDLLWSIENKEFREREVRYEFNKSADYIIRLDVVNQYGCKTRAEETIKILIEHVFYLPNAFTPNTNGINSEFGPIGENMNFKSYQLLIVDSTGKTVFNSNDVDYKWNGKMNNVGENSKPGFYLWEIKTLDEFGNMQTKKGRVNLIWQ
ncbi:MAG: gliding motility-associated C-terminal domain-containing protein [Bacteroidales bacterium]|nr:gliding motility-associated C-terminal domain-containing protein [Bacteroidales bacterium]